MAQDIQKVKLGACKVLWDSATGGTPLTIETTIGGVVLNLKQTSFNVKTDQTGNTIVKKIKDAVECSVDVPIGEYDLVTIAKMIPGATLVAGTGVNAGKSKVIVDGNSGQDLLAGAKQVTIQPVNGAADGSDNITLFKAVPDPQFKFTYKVDGERITNVVFQAFPDSANANQMLCFGDPTIS